MNCELHFCKYFDENLQNKVKTYKSNSTFKLLTI